jgi:hypothetical protein
LFTTGLCPARQAKQKLIKILSFMIRAVYKDRALVADILAKSFDQNKSVNYIIKQGKRKAKRIRRLMEYSFDICYQYGDIFLSSDKKSCALLVFPDKKKTSFKSVASDIKLATGCIGIANIKKTLDREAKIKKNHPKESMYYLWFIGVDPEYQHKGTGSSLLDDVITESIRLQRPLYLETSTPKNIPWYKKFGFAVYQELDLGYNLFFLKRDL